MAISSFVVTVNTFDNDPNGFAKSLKALLQKLGPQCTPMVTCVAIDGVPQFEVEDGRVDLGDLL